MLSPEEATVLLAGIVSQRSWACATALIAAMTYTFARVGAVVELAAEDYYPQKKRWWLRLTIKTVMSDYLRC